MEAFNKRRIKEVSDKIQALLDKLGKDEGIELKMAGGNFSQDSFTLKVSGKLLNESGSKVISEATHAMADRAATTSGISYSTPHFIGSVWNFRSSGLVRVEEYTPKNRKYPFICKVYEEDRRVKATALSFNNEVPMPSEEDFHLWLITDVESDAITKKVEDIYDRVNDFVSVSFEGDAWIDPFYEECGYFYDTLIEGKKDIDIYMAVSSILYGYVIKDKNLKSATEYLRSVLGK